MACFFSFFFLAGPIVIIKAGNKHETIWTLRLEETRVQNMQSVSSVAQHLKLNGTNVPVPRHALSCLHTGVWLGSVQMCSMCKGNAFSAHVF